MLWVRAESWGECRRFATRKEMTLDYEDSFEGRFATVSVTEVELAEAFLEQEEEQQAFPDKPDPEDDALEEGVIVARPAPSIQEKPKKGKGKDKKGSEKNKGQGRRADSRGRSGTPVPSSIPTRSAYIMPVNRYPVAVSAAKTP